MNKKKEITIVNKKIESCRQCKGLNLPKKTMSAPGHGSLGARLFVIGQSLHSYNPNTPDCQIPFVGPVVASDSGILLYDILRTGGFSFDKKNMFITNVVHCLDYNTRIEFEDGRKLRLGYIVNNKIKGKIKTIDKKGRITFSHIKNWYKSKVEGRKLKSIRYSFGKNNSNGFVKTILTDEHKVLTKRGFISVSKLDNDYINTGTFAPNKIMEQLIYGTMLGDATIGGNHLSVAHSTKHKEYVELKYNLLKSMTNKKGIIDIKVSTSSGKYGRSKFYTKNYPYFNYLRDIWYKKGKKTIPFDIESKLTDFALAIWYMDDGGFKCTRYNRAMLCTYSFSKRDCEILIEILNKKGFECKLSYKKVKYGSVRKYPYIEFTVNGTETLHGRIVKYIPKIMRYKILGEYRGIEFDSKIYEKNKLESFYDKVIVEKSKIIPKNVYCVEIENTHCFVTPGGVVSNCHPPENRTSLKDEKQNCSDFLREELRIINPPIIMTVGKDAREWFDLPKIKGNVTRFHKKYNGKLRVFIMIHHPSFILRYCSENRKREYVKDIQHELRILVKGKN